MLRLTRLISTTHHYTTGTSMCPQSPLRRSRFETTTRAPSCLTLRRPSAPHKEKGHRQRTLVYKSIVVSRVPARWATHRRNVTWRPVCGCIQPSSRITQPPRSSPDLHRLDIWAVQTSQSLLKLKGWGLGHPPFHPWVNPVRPSTLSIDGMQTD
jgi:hypothetical protein